MVPERDFNDDDEKDNNDAEDDEVDKGKERAKTPECVAAPETQVRGSKSRRGPQN